MDVPQPSPPPSSSPSPLSRPGPVAGAAGAREQWHLNPSNAAWHVARNRWRGRQKTKHNNCRWETFDEPQQRLQHSHSLGYVGEVQYVEVRNNHDAIFALGRFPSFVSASPIGLGVVAEGAQWIPFVMYSHPGGHAIGAREQLANVAHVRLSCMRTRHITNARVVGDVLALVANIRIHVHHMCMHTCRCACVCICACVCVCVCVHMCARYI